MRGYRSFLVRCWDLAGGDRHLEVQQVQTGERAIFATAQEVAVWIDAHSPRGLPIGQAAMPGHADSVQGACSAGADSPQGKEVPR